jgi:hypothetical protein
MELYSGELLAFAEGEQSKQALADQDWREYIWQFAPSKHQALSQHHEKMSLWHRDMDSGLPEKETY